MKRASRIAIVSLVSIAALGSVALAATTASPPATAKDAWIAAGSPPTPQVPLALVGPGNVWDNGAFNGVNGLTSERDTVVTGTGGPEGLDGSDVADDFTIGQATVITEIHACILTLASTRAHLYIYEDGGGSPALPVTAPLWGAPTTAGIVSNTYQDNTTRCAPAFGFTGRSFIFSAATTGVSITLQPGHYWLLVVGDGQGNATDRDFWADSTPAVALSNGVWGSTFFGIPYWSDTGGQGQPAFAFDIYGAAVIPTLSRTGLAALALLIVASAAWVMRRRRLKTR